MTPVITLHLAGDACCPQTVINDMNSSSMRVLLMAVPAVATACADFTEPVVCPSPGRTTLIAEVRDENGAGNALGTRVYLQNTQGYYAMAQGFHDTLRISAGSGGRNQGGRLTVLVFKTDYKTVLLTNVVVPEGPCGVDTPKVVEVRLTRLPGTKPAVGFGD